MLTDDDIDRLQAHERAELILRLSRPLSEVGISRHRLVHARRLRITLMTASAVVLVPWTVYLAFTLPPSYQAHNWNLTWVGFDVILLLLTLATLALGARRRMLVIPLAFATGVLVACDAWFDMMTAGPDDRVVSIVTAVVFELPLAALLVSGGLKLLGVVAQRMWLIEPGQHVWQVRLPDPGGKAVLSR